MKNSRKGFTLIELLVVIAIIGILSAVVLASLNTARAKGQDAAVKSNLNGARTQAELYYDENANKYNTGAWTADTGVCGVTGIQKQVLAAGTATGGTAACYASSTAYAVSAPLKAGGNWCIDSTGVSATTSAAISASKFTCN